MRPAHPDIADPTSTHDNYIAPLFSLPLKLPQTAWQGHIPFLFVLFRNLKPSRYVDLGVHLGASLIAAATAAQACHLGTELFGVDTWQGDGHAGAYSGDQIYADLRDFCDRHFANTTLMRSTFDEARAGFADGSVDLLHIDGLHTYEAVKHDYETWLPTMSDKGVILFHDIMGRDRGFGVWRLWEELTHQFPSLSFAHSHGLGVLFVGSDSLWDPHMREMVQDPSLFAGYRSSVEQIASLLPLRYAHQAFEAQLVASVSESLPANVIVQNYKNQLETVRKPFRRLVAPKQKGFLSKLGLKRSR